MEKRGRLLANGAGGGSVAVDPDADGDDGSWRSKYESCDGGSGTSRGELKDAWRLEWRGVGVFGDDGGSGETASTGIARRLSEGMDEEEQDEGEVWESPMVEEEKKVTGSARWFACLQMEGLTQ